MSDLYMFVYLSVQVEVCIHVCGGEGDFVILSIGAYMCICGCMGLYIYVRMCIHMDVRRDILRCLFISNKSRCTINLFPYTYIYISAYIYIYICVCVCVYILPPGFLLVFPMSLSPSLCANYLWR